MIDDQTMPSLFDWKPTCIVKPFPLNKRREKVRDVAQKLVRRRTEAHIDQYVEQVTVALRRQLQRINVPAGVQEKLLSDFWIAVDLEAARISHHASRGNNPRGAA